MQQGVVVRINGVLPDAGGSGKPDAGANTSCSVFDIQQNEVFHLLVDAGSGVLESIRQGASELGRMPDAVLVTHAHRGHTSDLPALVSAKADCKIYCTKECLDQITKEFPSLSGKIFPVQPGQAFDAGPFSIMPVAASHGDLPGCVIYIVKIRDTKIIAGWDFASLPGADPDLLWKPDLLVLGTETYNDHQSSTGMISVSEAYNIVRGWNAKDCFIVHYSGQKDTEDARNQWFRGPTRPLAPDELQKVVDDQLRISGDNGRFSIRVAKQGMTWAPSGAYEEEHEDNAIGNMIEIEGLEKYVMSIEKAEGSRLNLTIEDSVNRLSAEFANPRKAGSTLEAEPLKSFMMKGPELKMSLVPGDQDSVVRVSIIKGKKPIFADEIRISGRDAKRLERYMAKNFAMVA